MKKMKKSNKIIDENHNKNIEKSVEKLLKEVGFTDDKDSFVAKEISSLLLKRKLYLKHSAMEENDYTKYHTWPC